MLTRQGNEASRIITPGKIKNKEGIMTAKQELNLIANAITSMDCIYPDYNFENIEYLRNKIKEWQIKNDCLRARSDLQYLRSLDLEQWLQCLEKPF